jgi:hypothetical protein
MNINCNKLKDPMKFMDLMTREWVRLTLTNAGSLNGVFLAACRHLLKSQPQYQQQYYMQLAIQYKLSCVRALREAIFFEMSSLISDSTIAIGLLLAYDEVRRISKVFSPIRLLTNFKPFSCSSVISLHSDAICEA